MADVASVLKDPNFHALPVEERRKVMVSLDPNFGGLAAGEQDKVLGAVTPPQEKSVGGFLSNAASSAGRFAGDIAGAVTHPGRTLEGVTGLLEGMAEKSGFKPVAGVSHEQNVDALMKMYKDRYGSIENFKNSMYTDPVGILADVATLASGVGVAGKGVELAADAAKLGKVADVAGAVAKGAKAVSDVADPLKLAGKVSDATGLTALAGKGADAASKALTRGALRGGMTAIGNTKDPAKIAEIVGENANAVSEMNTRNLPLSEKGQATITQALNDLQQSKLGKLRAADQGGLTIDPARVELRLDQLENELRTQANSKPKLDQIAEVRKNFRQQYGHGPLGMEEAEAVKSGTYGANNYSPQPHEAARVEAEKALARGFKEELENAIPELTGLNEKQAKLLDLQGVLARAVAKRNQAGGFWGNIVKQTLTEKGGLKLGGLGAAGYYSGHPELAGAVAAMQAVLSDPAVKQRLATAIHQAQRANPGKYGVPSMATALSRVNEYTDQLDNPNNTYVGESNGIPVYKAPQQ